MDGWFCCGREFSSLRDTLRRASQNKKTTPIPFTIPRNPTPRTRKQFPELRDLIQNVPRGRTKTAKNAAAMFEAAEKAKKSGRMQREHFKKIAEQEKQVRSHMIFVTYRGHIEVHRDRVCCLPICPRPLDLQPPDL